MITILDILKFPTTVTHVPHDSRGVHESMLRSYQILQKVKEWLARGVPNSVIIELIEALETNPEGEST